MKIRKNNGELTVYSQKAVTLATVSYKKKGGKVRLYLKEWVNNGRNLVDWEVYVKQILREKSFKISTGNDAPRCGKEGDYLEVSKKALDYLFELKN